MLVRVCAICRFNCARFSSFSAAVEVPCARATLASRCFSFLVTRALRSSRASLKGSKSFAGEQQKKAKKKYQPPSLLILSSSGSLERPQIETYAHLPGPRPPIAPRLPCSWPLVPTGRPILASLHPILSSRAAFSEFLSQQQIVPTLSGP